MPYRWLRYGSPLKSDETIVLFPQSASYSPSKGWNIPVHAWIVELENGSLSRRIGQHAVLELLGLSGVTDDQKSSEVFRRRLSWFMADREINKRLNVQIESQVHQSPRSRPSGHLKFTVPYTGLAPDGSILDIAVCDAPGPTVNGQVQLVPPLGISVISDIDDTIKISNVTDKKDLIKGVFFDQYKVVDAMPQFYQHLYEQDVCFHYVSSSPWQIFPSLSPMLKKFYPYGSVSLRHFYIADRSFIDFFRHSKRYKLATISALLDRYPQREFILIGDSGEKDPEIYCEIAGKYKDRIKAILIRQVPYVTTDESLDDGLALAEPTLAEKTMPAFLRQRWRSLGDRLPDRSIFKVFSDPSELYEFTDAVIEKTKNTSRSRSHDSAQ